MTNSHEDLRKVYEELCTSYRAIDDFRAKLLGFLPLATGTGIFLLTGSLRDVLKLATGTGGQDLTAETTTFLWAAGAFGFAITLGLFFYELYGVKKCHALINAGKKLEEELGIAAQKGGQFTQRPREVAGLINEPFAAGVIYPAVLAAWIFLALFFKSQDALWWAIGVFIVGFAVVFLFNLTLKYEEKIRNLKIKARSWWKHLEAKMKKDTHTPEVMSSERVSTGTRVEVTKTLIDDLKNGRTLDDFVEDHPTVSREQAEDYLEHAKESFLEQTLQVTGEKSRRAPTSTQRRSK